MSLCSSFSKSSSVTAQVSLPYRTTLLTHAWNILPFVNSENTLGVSKGKSLLNFFHPHLILATVVDIKQAFCRKCLRVLTQHYITQIKSGWERSTRINLAGECHKETCNYLTTPHSQSVCPEGVG